MLGMDTPMPVEHLFGGFGEPYSDVATNYDWTEEYLRRNFPHSGFTPAARALYAGRAVMARWFFACGCLRKFQDNIAPLLAGKPLAVCNEVRSRIHLLRGWSIVGVVHGSGMDGGG